METKNKFKKSEDAQELAIDPMEHVIIESPLVPPKAFEIDDRLEASFYLDLRDKNSFIKFLLSRLKRHYEINYNTAMSNFADIFSDETEFPKEAKLMCFEEILIITRELQNRIKELQYYTDQIFEDDGITSGSLRPYKNDSKDDDSLESPTDT